MTVTRSLKAPQEEGRMIANARGLSTSQRDFFDREGYLVIDDVFDPARDFKLLNEELGNILNRIARRLLKAGDIKHYDSEESFGQRVLQVLRAPGAFPAQEFDISLPQRRSIDSDTPIYLGDGAFSILTHPILLDLVESIVGPEITSSPIQHIRVKTPLSLARKDNQWNGIPDENTLTTSAHQDIGVQSADADASEVLTVWMPITDVSAEMGCLGVWPRHHRGGILNHCPGDEGLAITPRALDANDFLPLPMRAGSVLLMTRYTPHRALPNLSDRVRWSMDLRYQPTGQINGRADFPDFVARSASNPESALADHNAWRDLWFDARARLAGQPIPSFNRWSADAPWCA